MIQKILSFVDTKRTAIAISIILCIALYFALLITVFTYKVDTFIVYTQEGINVIHGTALCHTDILGNDLVLDLEKPIITTTAYDCPDHKWCAKCSRQREKTTITRKDYVTPLLISIPTSGLLLFVLAYKKSY